MHPTARNLIRLLWVAVIAVSLGFVWTVGQGGLKQTNTNLCELWRSLPFLTYESCEFQQVLVYIWLGAAILGAVYIFIELYIWIGRQEKRGTRLFFHWIVTLFFVVGSAWSIYALVKEWRKETISVAGNLVVPADAAPPKRDVTPPKEKVVPPKIVEMPAPILPPPPVPTTPPKKPGRDYVNAEITPEYLVGLYDGNTKLRAETLVSEQVGKWMRVSGPLGEIHASGKTDALVVFSSRKEPTIYMWFTGEWIARLALLPKNQNINVEGQLKKVTGYNTTVELENCELLDGPK
jgi:hypothetical protein